MGKQANTKEAGAQDADARLAKVRGEIAQAARAAGRKAEAVTLIAVSKGHEAEAILPVLAAGQRVFGENRVQEALRKWKALKESARGIALHLIGPLQTNKAREAVQFFDAIHSVDRERLAAALAEEMAKQGRRPQLFVQVNTGEEAQKSGVLPREAGAFVKKCREEFGLAVSGLMCIPPLGEEASLHFALLARIARENGLTNLSMGMSADFAKAIAQGATHVRVGTAIFGRLHA